MFNLTSFTSLRLTPAVVLFLALFLPDVSAQHEHMPMTDDMPMALMVGSMIPWLHFTPGDNLWFEGWVPADTKAMVGACFGLFLLAIIDRWLAAVRSMMEVVWREKAYLAYVNALNASKRPLPSISDVITMRSLPPFMPMYDFPRGFLHACQAALGFLFMLAVMTFQVGFLLSIVIGLGVGETLFGRYSRGAHLH